MTYASPADIRECAAPDGNFSGTCGELTDDQLNEPIVRAQSLVDGSTGKAFTDSNVPPLLKGLVIALGTYYATLAYRKGKDLSQFDPIYLLYQDATATLQQIRNGEIDIIPAGPDVDPVPAETAPKVINPLLYGVTAFTKDDFALTIRSGWGGWDGPRLEDDPAIRDMW